MSVLQPISFGLVHQIGPGSGAKGYGGYQADNTDVMRPYQQQGASPIGRGYPITVISGDPTFFTPDVKEDPIITLLKMLVNQGRKVVKEKEPDAGFRNNLPVFPPEGPAGDPPNAGGNALGAVPAGDMPNAGVGPAGDMPNAGVGAPFGDLGDAEVKIEEVGALPVEERMVLNTVVERATSMAEAGAAVGAVVGSFGSQIGPSMDIAIRQLEEVFSGYVPAGISEEIIRNTRYVSDLILNAQRTQQDMVRMGERAVSDYVIRPVQQAANRGLQMLLNQAASQHISYGEVDPNIISRIVDFISNNPTTSRAVTIAQGAMVGLIALWNPMALRRARHGLRQNPTPRSFINGVPRIRGG
jgi:hypothetical protein